MGLEPKTLLIVEDDPLLALTEAHWLKKAGYSSIHALTGEEAIRIVHEQKSVIDLILMDINLGPGIDGTQAAEEILKEYDIPLLFLSSHTEKEVVEKTERITSYGYVIKDSKDVVLLASIKMAFKLHSVNKELRFKEKALRESEHKFRNAVEASSDGIFIHTDGIIKYVNPALIRLSGFNQEEMIGKPFINFVHPDSLQSVLDRYKRRQMGETVETAYEAKLLYNGGKTCIAEINVAPISYNNDPAILITVRDVTQRKQVEAELRESEKRYKALLQSVTDYNYSVELENGKVISNSHSPGCVAITGYSPEEFKNDAYLWYKMVYDEDKGHVVKETENIFDGKTPATIEHRIVHKDGTIKWIRNSFVLHRNSEDKLIGYDGLIEDITERKTTEEALRYSEEQLRYLIEGTSDFFFYTQDVNGNITYISPSIESITGHKVNEWIGQKHWFVTESPMNEIAKENTRTHLRGELTTGPVNLEIYHANGNRILLEGFEHPIIRNNKVIGLQGIAHDITQRHIVEEHLAETLGWQEAIFEGSRDAIFISDLDSKFVSVNRAACQLTGYSKEELMHMKIPDLHEEQDLEAYLLFHKRIMNGEELVSEARILKKNGNKIDTEFSNKRIYLDGEYYMHTSARDVTERKLAQISLEESEKKYRDLVEKTLDGVYKSTHEGKFLEVNEAMANMLGYDSREDLMAIDIKKQLYFHETDRESAALQEKLEEMAIFRLKKKDGSEIWVEDHGRHVIDENGKVLYHEGIMRDVTERVKSEKLQKALYEISETAYLASDTADVYKRIHKIISDLIKIKNYYIAIYDESNKLLSFPYFVDEYDEQPNPKKLGRGLTEYVLRTKKSLLVDSKKDAELRNSGDVDLIGTPQAIWLGVPLMVGGKAIGVIVVQDYNNRNAFGEEEMHLLNFISEHIAQVIERKMNEEEIKKITSELRQSNQMKDKFFSIIAHDLKNPFHTITAVLKLLLSEDDVLSKEEKNKFLNGLLSTSEKAHSLLENLLLWSQHQMGKMNYEPEKIELAEIVFSSIEFLKNGAYLKNISLVSHITDEIYLFADRNMIETAFRNIISNAIKFTKDDGKIEVDHKINKKSVTITIKDNGVGIGENDLKKLFRIDQTFTTQGTRSETGTGLGLILCKEFIEKNKGTIKIDSKIGKGTKIIITLPLAE